MINYRVYQDVPIPDSKETKRYYLKENGEFTDDKTGAKIWRVINIIIIILKLAYEHGLFNNLKIERK